MEQKKIYIIPTIKIQNVKTENCISAGSNETRTGIIQEQWDDGNTVERDFEW